VGLLPLLVAVQGMVGVVFVRHDRALLLPTCCFYLGGLIMPLLGVLVSGLFAGLADFFLAYFTKEVALRLAFGTLFVGGFAVLFTTVSGILSGLSLAMPDALVAAFQTAFPSNLSSCVTAAITTDSVCAGYRLYLLGAGAGR
jgi:hypothetical protein